METTEEHNNEGLRRAWRPILADLLIGEAMLFSGVTARRWFGELPQEPLPERELPAPIGALLSLLVVLTFIGLLVVHIRKLWRGSLNHERADSSSSSA